MTTIDDETDHFQPTVSAAAAGNNKWRRHLRHRYSRHMDDLTLCILTLHSAGIATNEDLRCLFAMLRLLGERPPVPSHSQAATEISILTDDTCLDMGMQSETQGSVAAVLSHDLASITQSTTISDTITSAQSSEAARPTSVLPGNGHSNLLQRPSAAA